MVYRVKRFGLIDGITDGVKTTAGGMVQSTGDMMKSGVGKTAGLVAGTLAAPAAAKAGATIGGAIGGIPGAAVGAGIGLLATPVLAKKATQSVGEGLHNMGQDLKMGG